MPADNVLHIQGRAEGPPAVVALQGSVIRIGRGRRCEVQLPGARLSDIQCVLRLEVDGWYVQPLGTPGLISIYGEPIFAARRLDFDTPLRVGDHWLTLRDLRPGRVDSAPVVIDAGEADDLEPEPRDGPVAARPPLPDLMAPLPPKPARPAAAPTPPPRIDPRREPLLNASRIAEDEADRVRRLQDWEAGLIERERRLAQLEEAKRWESRWRAAGELLRRRGTTSTHVHAQSSPLGPHRPAPVPRPAPSATPPPPVGSTRIPRVDPSRADLRAPRPPEAHRSHPRPIPPARPVDAAPARTVRPESRESRPAAQPKPPAADAVDDRARGLVILPSSIVATPIPDPEPIAIAPIVAEPEPVLEPPGSRDAFFLGLVPTIATDPDPVIEAESIDAMEAVIDDEPLIEAESIDAMEAVIEDEPPIEAESIDAMEAVIDDEPPIEAESIDVLEAVIEDEPLVEAESIDVLESVIDDEPVIEVEEAVEVSSLTESPAFEPVFPIFEVDWRQGPDLGPLVDVDPLVTTCAPEAPGFHSSIAGIPSWQEPVEPIRVVIEPTRSHVAHAQEYSRDQPFTEAPASQPEPEAAPYPAAAGPFVRALPPVDPAPFEPRVSMPTAGAILAAQGTRTLPEPTRKRRTSSGPTPTELRSPEQWRAPFWLAALPALGLLIGVGGGGLAISSLWALDEMTSSRVFATALRGEGEGGRLDPQLRPETAWYRTTALELAAWALALERSGDGPTAQEEAARLLEAARHISPLHPVVRYAAAQAPNAEVAVTLGLSRDAVPLALTAAKLLERGKTEAAFAVYRRAFLIAAESEVDPRVAPKFDEDSRVRRYLLSRELEIRAVARGLIEPNPKPFAEWSAALPESSVARLTVARMLLERGSTDAEAALDFALAVADPSDGAGSAIHWAAKGEALALRGRPDDAAVAYRKAIELGREPAETRLHAFNLAEILRPTARDSERAEMLARATADDPSDEVSRRAIDARAMSGMLEPIPAAAAGTTSSDATAQSPPAPEASAAPELGSPGGPRPFADPQLAPAGYSEAPPRPSRGEP